MSMTSQVMPFLPLVSNLFQSMSEVLLPNCLEAAVPRLSANVHSRDVRLDVKPPNPHPRCRAPLSTAWRGAACSQDCLCFDARSATCQRPQPLARGLERGARQRG